MRHDKLDFGRMILQSFACDHLHEPVRSTMRPFREDAEKLAAQPASVERDRALTELLDRANAAVRATIEADAATKTSQ